jgi:hypothetical protein
VTSVAVFEAPGEDAPVGGGFRAISGTPVTGGSGSGLKLDVRGADGQGGVASVGVTVDGAGSGYKIGDMVQFPVAGPQIAAEALGVTIGGGLTISGAVYHAVDIQGFQGTRCPVSASLENVTISGPNSGPEILTGIYQRNASLKVSGIQFTHVTSSTDAGR